MSAASAPALTEHPPFVVDTSHSPFCRLRPLDLTSVRLTDRFWAPRRELIRTVTLPSQYRQLEETGRLDNFRRAAGLAGGDFQGRNFSDSDIYKWLEAAAWILSSDPEPELAVRVEETISLVAPAQDPDGYLDTYFTGERAGERWTDLKWAHELYLAGHLSQAAVAHHRATGMTSLLDVAVRFADNILGTFGPQARAGADGHPEIEMALVELARETNDERYLREAEFFLDQRGQQPPVISGDLYAQDHAPFREQHTVVGHGVRALYLYSGATDLYLETGDRTLMNALETLWADLHDRKIYITGGVGARHEDEAVGEAHELPNRTAYAETCAAIAEVMWSWRMLLATGEARFADAMETALYNGALAGISLDGELYFYENPLAARSDHRRRPWFEVSCCPPNIARLIASLPGYLYSTSDEGVWVHLYASSTATFNAPDGSRVTVTQETDYPWAGDVELALDLSEPVTFDLMLRVPAWCERAEIEVNGEPVREPASAGRYATIRREWRAGDTVRLRLAMPVRLMASHPHVLNNHGRVAVTRGPLVYCIEGTDHGDFDVWDLGLGGDEWTSTFEPDMLGGVVVLRSTARAPLRTEREQPLYVPYEPEPARTRTVPLTAIPYYAWANREPGPMVVWLPAVP